MRGALLHGVYRRYRRKIMEPPRGGEGVMDLGKLRQRIEKSSMPITESGCWIWMKALSGGNGYGITWDGQKVVRAHRASWLAFNGSIDDGLCVLHHCDTPSCVNPAHLFVGTQADNIRDCVRKGRPVGMNGKPAILGCNINGCSRNHYAKGMCKKHYQNTFRKEHGRYEYK
jgi:hypothetical protein